MKNNRKKSGGVKNEPPKYWTVLRGWCKTPIGKAFFEPLGISQLMEDAIHDCTKAKSPIEFKKLVAHYNREIKRAVPASLAVHLSIAWVLHSAVSFTDGLVLYVALIWFALMEIFK